ncbi:MAG: hypothetical protein RLZZ91_652 [Bacteroidota bacterium]|jgi:peptide methionine sulfoxide reductase MsrB
MAFVKQELLYSDEIKNTLKCGFPAFTAQIHKINPNTTLKCVYLVYFN